MVNNEKENYQCKPEKLIRWGGLTATPHDIHYKQRKSYYHTPPSKSGIFCFLKGYVEEELFNWKIKDKNSKKESHLRKRDFSYRGRIWTHLKVQDKRVRYYNQKGSWYETDTDSLRIIFKKFNHDDIEKKLHYEVFIDKKNLGGL